MKKDSKNEINARLRYALRVRRLSSSELCRLTGIPFSSISGYVSGKFTPKITTVCKIANAMGVSINWLVGNLPLNDINMPDYVPIDDKNEIELLQHFRSLNLDGQAMAVNIIKGLSAAGDYCGKQHYWR